MRYRLPPLNSLRLFEAAARLHSFKAAAEELDLPDEPKNLKPAKADAASRRTMIT